MLLLRAAVGEADPLARRLPAARASRARVKGDQLVKRGPGPVIEQAKKNAVLVRHGYPADPKSLAHARTLMSAGRGWKQCGKTSRSKESGSLHCHSNVAAEQAFHRRK
jgi:hypothetical protein